MQPATECNGEEETVSEWTGWQFFDSVMQSIQT